MESTKNRLVVGVSVFVGSFLAAAAAAYAQDPGPDYTVLTTGLKNDAVGGIEQALPIVGLVLAAIIVVGLIRKFAKAR